MIIPSLLLTTLGIVVILTSSQTLAIQQLIFAVIGVSLYFLLSNFDYRSFNFFIKPLYFFALLLLIVTFALGVETRGSVRWISLGPFNLQPSEFAKPILILTLANFWSGRLATWKNMAVSLVILAPLALLIFNQPDLGTTLTALFIWVVILLSTNISLKKILSLGLIALVTAPLVWLNLQPYQKQRLIGFAFPNQDPQGIGFHVIQSTIAVGSGQLFGRGLGSGTQSRLQFLPEFRTDFIFAFIAEELGLVGSLIVLFGYSVIFFLVFKKLARVNNRFGELIIIGVSAMLFFQVTVNIGMNVGLLPITGITLPLLSYGGSSIVATFISLGLVSSVLKFGMKRKEVDVFRLIDT